MRFVRAACIQLAGSRLRRTAPGGRSCSYPATSRMQFSFLVYTTCEGLQARNDHAKPPLASPDHDADPLAIMLVVEPVPEFIATRGREATFLLGQHDRVDVDADVIGDILDGVEPPGDHETSASSSGSQ